MTEPTDSVQFSRGLDLVRTVPATYASVQSTEQAFYFVNNATINGELLEEDDLIIAYNGDVIVGSRYWAGELTDVPAMGQAYSEEGYCQAGDVVTFKVYDSSADELIEMTADASTEWQDLGYYSINLENRQLPTTFALGQAYPNPFNPVTTSDFELADNADVSMVIYNVQGREVATLISGNLDAGYHSVVWNADTFSSGMYFLHMNAAGFTVTQKLMIVK